MTQGILVIARNNSKIDYTKQAAFLADSVKKILNLPTSIITDSPEYLEKNNYRDKFDKVIPIVWTKDKLADDNSNVLSKGDQHFLRRYRDGTLSHQSLQFKNEMRSGAFDVTPYDETLLLDTDIILMNDVYKHCFTQPHDFLIYDKSYDLAGFRDKYEFKFISDTGAHFYWATAVFFRKTQTNKIFFDLVQHVQENWYHYRSIFQIPASLFRNDFAFSIAVHIMNGYQEGDFAKPMPGKLFFTTDKDILWDKTKDGLFMLLEKEEYLGEYTAAHWKKQNLHVMNKFSLERYINKVTNV